jgi:hypothetical protein
VPSPLDVALDYIRRGWNPVPVHYRSKKPSGGEGWQHIRVTAQNAANHFNGERQNIGVQFGEPSHDLRDVDLDCTESRIIAPYVLPRTDSIFGRETSRNSHWLYYAAEVAAFDKAAHAFDDPRRQGDDARLLELRTGGGGKGAQSVFPGSIHEDTGEEIKWETDGTPATTDGEELLRKCRMLAAYCLLARHWPRPGSGHHDAARVVGGFLARAGNHPAVVRTVVTAIAKAAPGCREDDIVRAAKDAADEYKSGGHAYGYPELAKTFGKDIADKVAEWLDYRNDEEQKAENSDPVAGLDEWDAGDDPGPIPPRQWLLANQFCCGFISSIVSAGGGGKSALRLLQLMSLALGSSLCGQYVFRRCRVLLVSLEDDRNEIERRIQGILNHYGIARSELKGWLFCSAPRGTKLAHMNGRVRGAGPLERQLRDAIARRKPVREDPRAGREQQRRHGLRMRPARSVLRRVQHRHR